MSDGFINLNKPANMTSHDAVNIVRKIFDTRKVGHAGTLDPAATGVLPVAVGRATKFLEYLSDRDKTYRAEILFGVATTTGDITGEILRREENFFMPGLDELKRAAKNFSGQIEQTPPKFSAIKLNGRKAYELARKNIDFELPKRIVTINRFEILSVEKNFVTVEVDCSKGTYIRTLAEDFGASLKLPATIKNLQRVRVGEFKIENSATPDELKNRGEEFLKPVEFCLTHFEKFDLPEHRQKAFLSGLPTDVFKPDSIVRVYVGEKFLGTGKISGGELKSDKQFATQ